MEGEIKFCQRNLIFIVKFLTSSFFSFLFFFRLCDKYFYIAAKYLQGRNNSRDKKKVFGKLEISFSLDRSIDRSIIDSSFSKYSRCYLPRPLFVYFLLVLRIFSRLFTTHPVIKTRSLDGLNLKSKDKSGSCDK